MKEHSQQALTVYLISNSLVLCKEKRSSQTEPSTVGSYVRVSNVNIESVQIEFAKNTY